MVCERRKMGLGLKALMLASVAMLGTMGAAQALSLKDAVSIAIDSNPQLDKDPKLRGDRIRTPSGAGSLPAPPRS